MKNITNTFPWKAVSLAVGAFLLNSCGSGKDPLSQLVNEASKVAKSCETYNTQSQADGENQVIRAGQNDYKFNLYWLGGKSEMTVWENKNNNNQYSVDTKDTTIKVIGDNQELTDTINCAGSPADALRCTTRLNDLVSMIKEARAAITERGAALSEGKDMTFNCAQRYSEKKIEDLKAIITP